MKKTTGKNFQNFERSSLTLQFKVSGITTLKTVNTIKNFNCKTKGITGNV